METMNNEGIYDYSIIVGRFQPLHMGHVELISRAQTLAKKTIVFIGHSGFDDMRHFLYPNTVDVMIKGYFGDTRDLITYPLYDMADDKKWVFKLNQTILNYAVQDGIKNPSIVFVGCKKDVVWYCNLLPSWDIVLIPGNQYNATTIRKEFFLNGKFNEEWVPEVTRLMLRNGLSDEQKSQMSRRYHDFYSIV